MKNKFIKTVGVIALLSVKLLAVDGPHGNLPTGTAGDNGEICVYCHTPHAANNELGLVPLWNKPTSTKVTEMGDSYPMYGSTLAGTVTTAKPIDQTLACLSCHDGVSAMNAVVNAPGSGTGGIYNSQLIGNISGNADVMTESVFTVGNVVAGNNGLENDHPTSIEYIPGRGSLRPLDTPLLSVTTAFGTYQWLGASVVKDLLRGPGKNMVHCSSCHDPHDKSRGRYLRQTNNDSELCFGCHDK